MLEVIVDLVAIMCLTGRDQVWLSQLMLRVGD